MTSHIFKMSNSRNLVWRRKKEEHFYSDRVTQWINSSSIFSLRYHGCIWNYVEKDSDYGCEEVGE